MLAQDVAHQLAEAMADDEYPLHVGPPEVEEAILEAQLLVRLGPAHLKGRSRRGVVQYQIGGPDLDRTRLELGVLLASKPGSDGSLDADDVLITEFACSGLQQGAGVGFEDHLGKPVAVAQVNEHKAAEIAPGVHPAIEHYGLPHMVLRQFSAGVSSFQKHGLFDRLAFGRKVRTEHYLDGYYLVDHDTPSGFGPSSTPTRWTTLGLARFKAGSHPLSL